MFRLNSLMMYVKLFLGFLFFTRVESVGLRVDDTSDPDVPKGFLVTAGQDGMVKYWNLDR